MTAGILVYALLVAVIARIVTAEALFAEVREWAKNRPTFVQRKIAYPLTCAMCFSVWLTAATMIATGFMPYGFVLTGALIVATANGFLVTYEHMTVKIKVQRTIDNFNLKQIELSETLIAGHKLQNQQAALLLEQTEIQTDSFRRLKSAADQHNAQIEAEEAKKQFPGTFVGGN